MLKRLILIGIILLLALPAYAIWPVTRHSDMISYYAPCWGPDNKIFFIKKVTHGQYAPWLGAIGYHIDKIEYYLCSMNYDGTDKKEIKEIMKERDIERLKMEYKKKYGKEWDGTSRLETYMNFSKSTQKLVYCVNWGIWSINVDGTDEGFLGDWDGIHPSFSPDGKKIAYHREITVVKEYDEKEKQEKGSRGTIKNYNSICIMDADGKNKYEILKGNEGESIESPIWSPKGDLIAFVCKGWIWVMKPDGSERRKVCETSHLSDWSPDGTMLMTDSGRGIIDLNGNTIKKVWASGRWSPDGKLFIAPQGFHIYTIEGKEIDNPLSVGIPHRGEHFVYKRPNNIW